MTSPAAIGLSLLAGTAIILSTVGLATRGTTVRRVPLPDPRRPCIVIANLQHNEHLPNGPYCFTPIRNLP